MKKVLTFMYETTLATSSGDSWDHCGKPWVVAENRNKLGYVVGSFLNNYCINT